MSAEEPLAAMFEANVSARQLSAHLRVDHYGEFRLTEAVRPTPALRVVPRQGYRRDEYRDDEAGVRVPVLAAAVSCERLFELFLDLLEPLGDTVDVVLETSHHGDGTAHQDRYREEIDLPVLVSNLYDFEDLLLNDGCTGVAVISRAGPMEVQFDEHKLLVVYAPDLAPFEAILNRHGIRRDDSLKLITEAEHLHSTDPHYVDQFEHLCYRLGVGEPAERVSW
jgi:hypothetical protein